MPVYTWEGRTRQGTTKKGVIEAANEAAVMTQLRGLVEDPLSEMEEIQRKIALIDDIDRQIIQVDREARDDLRELLDARQEAQLLVFREAFRQRIEQRLRGLQRERRQREEMRRGREPRRNERSRGEEAP